MKKALQKNCNLIAAARLAANLFWASHFRVRDHSTTDFLNRYLSSRQIHTLLLLLRSTIDANGRYDSIPVIKPINIRLTEFFSSWSGSGSSHGSKKSNRVLIGSITSTEFFLPLFFKTRLINVLGNFMSWVGWIMNWPVKQVKVLLLYFDKI